MQSVGAAWLMISLKSGPLYVALIQAASALPFFVFALPAGAIGDIMDRRKLILSTETWMLLVALTVAGLAIMGWMSPLLLLIMTFALSAGDAFETPTWRAVLPELVSTEDLQAASALNGIEFNFARAVGPGLAGFIVAAAGVGTAFVINALSFIGVIAVIARWKQPVRKRVSPPETVWRGTVTGLRYVRYSPAIRRLLLRTGVVAFFATALTALLPLIARNIRNTPVIFGVLLGCFGLGAVLGAVLMQRARARWSAEIVVSSGVIIYGLATLAAAACQALLLLCAAIFVAGAAWIVFISIINVMVFNRSPDWVRARVLSISTLVLQGSVAAGSAAWGILASHYGLTTTLACAGAGTVAATAIGFVYPLPLTTVDVTAWNHWPLPELDGDSLPGGYDAGPVLVTLEYEVPTEHRSEFLSAIRRYGRIRRRDGASRWNVYHDLESASRYVETFIVSSWGEHLRQHERLTRADREIEEHLGKYIQGSPKVRHLVSVKAPE